MSGRPGEGRVLLAVALLEAGMVAWAAVPADGPHAPVRAALLVAAVVCALFTLLRLVRAHRASVAGPRQRGVELYSWGGAAFWRQLRAAEATVPWAQLLIVAVLVLEAVQPDRPWHTGVLALLLLAFLLALHLAESGAPAGVFRPQLPLLAAGLGLAALSVAAAALPDSGGGGWLAVLAAGAAVLVAGLALPV